MVRLGLRAIGPVDLFSQRDLVLSIIQRRRNPADVTEDIEDAGLFKRKLVQIEIELRPQCHQNSRKDLVFRGMLRNREISVVFAGRRAQEAQLLPAMLTKVLLKSREAAVRAKRFDPRTEQIGCRTQIEGAWRARFERDPSGWETKSYQFLAARWLLVDASGTVVQFGSLPKTMPQ